MADPHNTKIVFMGTPAFAAGVLHSLIISGMPVVGVVTAPDRPAGRGQTVRKSEVKQCALKNSLPLLQPASLKDPQFISDLRSLGADLFIVVAFRKLPEAVWKIPRMGTINLHASLLPQYRGAAPIQHALIQGESSTGVTTFLINENIDTGNLLLQKKVDIAAEDDAGSLHDKLLEAGASLVLETVAYLCSGKARPVPQDELVKEAATLRTAPKIFREDGRIRWELPARQIHNLVRGLSPQPGAWTVLLDGKGKQYEMKILSAELTRNLSNGKPGTLVSDHRTILEVNCGDFRLSVKELQLEGKKRMPVSDFLRGFSIEGFRAVNPHQALP